MSETKKIKTILLVDDDMTQLSIFSNYINQMGYQVFTASNGQAAIVLAIRHKPHLIIMDYVMPIMDGQTAVRHLKFNNITKQIPIIMTSADKIQTPQCFFLQKPFSKSDLEKSIKDMENTLVI